MSQRVKLGLYCMCVAGLWQPLFATASEQAPSPIERLRAQNTQFEKHIVQVAPNVYAGIGYAGSNASMIVGEDGVIIVDTLPGLEAAEILRAEFRKVSTKPVKAIIYTHGHMDHIGGAKVFAGDDNPQIIASDNAVIGSGGKDPLNSISGKRAMRQFGRILKPETEKINLGVGPAIQPMGGFGRGALRPNKRFVGERQELNIAGVEVHLVAAPGETDDQLYVWLPDSKVLFAGDNFYSSFPNIYALRGTPYRDVTQWADSLDKMSKELPEALVPGHTLPVVGAKEVKQTLHDYRDAIRFVHDKTLEGMNKGFGPDQLVDYVKLPERLASRPYLTEFYGRVDTAVRAIYTGYLGWFDGNPTNLSNFSLREEASRVAELTGGEDALLAELNTAVEQGDYVWALRLADYLMVLTTHHDAAKEIKIASLRALADETLNAPTRNYYLSFAKELSDQSKANAR